MVAVTKEDLHRFVEALPDHAVAAAGQFLRAGIVLGEQGTGRSMTLAALLKEQDPRSVFLIVDGLNEVDNRATARLKDLLEQAGGELVVSERGDELLTALLRDDPVGVSLALAPPDDEPETDGERAAVADAWHQRCSCSSLPSSPRVWRPMPSTTPSG